MTKGEKRLFSLGYKLAKARVKKNACLTKKQPKESQTESLLLVLTLLKYANVI